MLALRLTEVRNVLCLGAHPDDIEIGCGGTLLTLLQKNDDLQVHWIVFSANAERGAEAKSSADRYFQGHVSCNLIMHDFRDSFFPHQGVALKECFEQCKAELHPDLIFTHHGRDLHQDHRVISELTWNTFRDHWILEYEVPKYDGGLGSPNTFVPLENQIANEKLRCLQEYFPSQTARPWFTADTFHSLMRLRGVECNAHSKLAEGFYSRKTCLQSG